MKQEDFNINEKEIYEKPEIEIIEMEHEGTILAGSGNDYNPGGGWGN